MEDYKPLDVECAAHVGAPMPGVVSTVNVASGLQQPDPQNPGQFIPLAELSDVIRPLTLWILRESLRDDDVRGEERVRPRDRRRAEDAPRRQGARQA